MADKPSYSEAHKARKGESSMTIEPLNPDSGPVKDMTEPRTFTDKALPMPGKRDDKISPEPKAGPGWRAEPAPAHPGDIKRPNQSDTIKT